MIRRLAALGLSGFFSTEGALRRAVGDTLPQDWVDFAAQQSERTRREFLERVATEIGKVFEGTDLREIAEQLLEGREIEVEARIRLRPRSCEGETPLPAAGGQRAGGERDPD